jgi:hypothetical protein
LGNPVLERHPTPHTDPEPNPGLEQAPIFLGPVPSPQR